MSTDKPRPLVPKQLVAELPERVDVDGAVIVALDETVARERIRYLVEERGVEAIAVSLLWAVRNPVHERRLCELVAELAPHVFVCCSSDLMARIGEYERTTTTVMNAYIGPLMRDYIGGIEAGAAKRGFTGEVLFAQCAGGAITDAEAKAAPIRTVQSGPVAGIVSSQMLTGYLGTPDVLLADMGGTTFDVSTISEGKGLRRNTSVFQRYELALPMLDVESVGAGGGSIAWVDGSGRLNVGPGSAGADPGPACYGQGGEEPTVTDADVLLGFISPDTFLGGRMRIHPELAERAIGKLVDRLGTDVYETAAGISRIVDAKMADLLRRTSVLRGLDPRKFAMYAFGGGGPVHAAAVAHQAGIGEVVVPLPPVTAVWSALGAAVTDVVYVYQEPAELTLPVEESQLSAVFDRLGKLALENAAQQGVGELEARLDRTLRMKYRMQVHDVDVPVAEAEPTGELEERFAAIYAEKFGAEAGYRAGGCDVTGFQLHYTGTTSKPPLRPLEPRSEAASVAERSVYWHELGRFAPTPVLRTRDGLLDAAIEGPALVELPDTVVAVRPTQRVSCDRYGNLHIDCAAGGKR